jgi:hypothetical protein
VNILIQGSLSAYDAVNLYSGWTVSSFLMKILASLDTLFHSLPEKLTYPSLIASNIC